LNKVCNLLDISYNIKLLEGISTAANGFRHRRATIFSTMKEASEFKGEVDKVLF
jgi:hypothetical protein